MGQNKTKWHVCLQNLEYHGCLTVCL